MATFYLDAVPISPRLHWARSAELEALGTETDMMKVGAPRNGVAPIIKLVARYLDDLDAIRTRLLEAGYGEL